MSVAKRVRRPAYLPYIDGLRAIAVLGVVLYHLRDGLLPGGFSGVDVFFVISGFVVSTSVKHWSSGGIRPFLGYFYARRLQRIAPALLACLLLTCLVSVLFIPMAWLSSTNDLTGLSAFFGVSNLYLGFLNETYFSPLAEFNPFLHTWSLGVEEQFYLLFPVLFFAWTLKGRPRRFATAGIALAVAVSLFHGALLSGSDPGKAFYLMSTRFWELGAGVLLFQLIEHFKEHPVPAGLPKAAAWGIWPFLGLLGWAMVASEPSLFPFPGALLPVIATLGLLACLYILPDDSMIPRLLGSRLARHIGTRSYSLYLWHWPVYVIMRWTCGLHTWPLALIGVVVTFLLAEVSYRWLESPFRYSESLRRWPRPNLISTGLAAMVTAAGLSALMLLARPQISLSTVSRHSDQWHAGVTDHLDAVPGCALRTRTDGDGATLAWIYTRSGCSSRPRSGPDIFAIGDSHAIGYRTMLSAYVLTTGATVSLYPNIGCTFASLQPQREIGACKDQGSLAIDDITRRAKQGDILFLAALRLNRLSNQDQILVPADHWHDMATELSERGRQEASEQLIAMLGPLREKGIRIVFEAPKPLFRSPPFRCSDPFNRAQPICAGGFSESRTALEIYRQPVIASLGRLATALGASVWDPLPLLCSTERCESVREQQPLFFDGDHLSADGNRLLLPSYIGFITSLDQPTSRKP